MVGEVFVDELTKGQLFDLREGIDGPERGRRASLQLDFVVVGTSGRKGHTFALVENVQVFVVCYSNRLAERFEFDIRRVGCGRGGGRTGSGSGIMEAGKEDGGPSG